MKRNSIAIEFRGYMTLIVVWELRDSCWEILSIVRLRCAIALVQESPTTRLVFPTGVLPNGVWGGVCKKHTARTNHLKADSLLLRQEKLLAMLVNSPGQRKESLAEQLSVSVATVRQLLRKLEFESKILPPPSPNAKQNQALLHGDSTNESRQRQDF